MREELDTLVDELKKLKAAGMTSILLEPETLEHLQQRAATVQSQAEHVEAPVVGASKPQRAPAASATAAAVPHKKPEPTKIERLTMPSGSKSEQWKWLREKVLNCPVCNSHVTPGKKIVFGVGSLEADIFFCGEAPGAEEEIQGEPFVGPAGELLTKIIKGMGLERESVYIGNILNWRPQTDTPYGNRPPTHEEMLLCLPYLRAQIEIVQPKIVVALGATATNGLLGHDPKRSITKCRGQWHHFDGFPTLITLHPSYVLRNGTKPIKRQIWEDMLQIMAKLNLPISDKQKHYFM